MAQWVKAGIVENRFEGDRVSQALKEAGDSFCDEVLSRYGIRWTLHPAEGMGGGFGSRGVSEKRQKGVIAEVRGGFTGRRRRDETGQPG